jgi:hypothetical protein
MIMRKEDLTDNAVDLGLWSSLCKIAGVEARREEDGDDIEIEITTARQSV